MLKILRPHLSQRLNSWTANRGKLHLMWEGRGVRIPICAYRTSSISQESCWQSVDEWTHLGQFILLIKKTCVFTDHELSKLFFACLQQSGMLSLWDVQQRGVVKQVRRQLPRCWRTLRWPELLWKVYNLGQPCRQLKPQHSSFWRRRMPSCPCGTNVG